MVFREDVLWWAVYGCWYYEHVLGLRWLRGRRRDSVWETITYATVYLRIDTKDPSIDHRVPLFYRPMSMQQLLHYDEMRVVIQLPDLVRHGGVPHSRGGGHCHFPHVSLRDLTSRSVVEVLVYSPRRYQDCHCSETYMIVYSHQVSKPWIAGRIHSAAPQHHHASMRWLSTCIDSTEKRLVEGGMVVYPFPLYAEARCGLRGFSILRDSNSEKRQQR